MPAAPLRLHDPHFHERTKIDEEILSIEQHLRDLRALRNSLLPISTLPHEVLCQIFQIASKTSAITIHRLTWVCYYWREVALGSPSLWVDIDPSLGTTWFQVHLERSKEANLSVTFYDSRKYPHMTDQLVAQFKRVSNMTLRNSRKDNSGDSILTTPAPALQSLEIQHAVIPPTLFSGIAPLLKRVDLSRSTGFLFSAIPFSSITNLRLASIDPRISVSDCLTNIHSFPNLQNLWLDSVLLASDPIDQDQSVQFNMPQLRLIALRGVRLATSVDFFSRISVHDELKTQVTIPSYYPMNVREHNHAYLQLISLLRTFEPSRKARLVISGQMLELSSVLPGDTTAKLVTVENGPPPVLLTEMLKQMPLQYVHSLKLCTHWFPSWAGTSSRLPNLEHLEVGRSVAISFIEHFASLKPMMLNCVKDGSGVSGNPSCFPFRTLRRLVLRDIESGDIPPKAVVTSFCKVLKLRKDLGIGLDELVALEVAPGFPTERFSLCAGLVRVEKSKK
ncbi:hypothetical protein BDN72DRAFT_845873 [Pluteus cervinus]|uniref:Uncharacterized protein n=1 Tax=Pluteus cervinus TaxID=181527 RepID=A0ACD3AIW5_9AGAR|nr:hypothetical protein BDN72DRAFT_845873 [Pluteus cervinus]